MRVDTYYPHELTATRMTENNPCEVGDKVIIEKRSGYNEEYNSLFGDRNKVKAKCISAYKFFINFSDGIKTFCVNKADIHTRLIKIELAR